MSSRIVGRLGSLTISVHPSAWVALPIMWGILSAVGVWALALPFQTALIAGLAATLLHIASEVHHNLGHAAAAQYTGHPMIGIRFVGPLGQSVYPKDEPPLSAGVHIRRALGGPAASALLTLAAGLVLLILRPTSGAVWYVAVFLFLDNLFVFTLGAFLPLGFTDGSTLLRYWKS